MGLLDSLSKGVEQGRADVKKERRVAELKRQGERELAEPNKVAMAFGRAIERVAPAKDKLVHGAKAADKAIDKIQGGRKAPTAPKPTADMGRFMPSRGTGAFSSGPSGGDSSRFAMPKRKW